MPSNASDQRRLWLFNFDAEEELAVAPAARAPELSQGAQAATQSAIGQLRRFLSPQDAVWGEPLAPERSFIGRAWCPTPTALARLKAAGATLASFPPLPVLKEVNERAFSYRLATLEGTFRVESANDPRIRGALLLKRGLAAAGRGQRWIHGSPDERDRRWIQRALRRGTLYAEPQVDVRQELAVHGEIYPNGEVRLGSPTEQRIDTQGQWASSRIIAMKRRESQTLLAAAERVADSLWQAGFFGPFGMDALRIASTGGSFIHAPAEINARYCMGWPIGMGGF